MNTIKILGPGCMNCNTLYKRTEEAIKELKLEINLLKVEDYSEIVYYKIMKTPALILNEKILFYGRVPTVREIKEVINNLI